MRYRQWKKNYKKQHGINPPDSIDKRKRHKQQVRAIENCKWNDSSELKLITNSRRAAEKIVEIMQQDQLEHFRLNYPERVQHRTDAADAILCGLRCRESGRGSSMGADSHSRYSNIDYYANMDNTVCDYTGKERKRQKVISILLIIIILLLVAIFGKLDKLSEKRDSDNE